LRSKSCRLASQTLGIFHRYSVQATGMAHEPHEFGACTYMAKQWFVFGVYVWGFVLE